MPTTQDPTELGLISEEILTQIVNSVIDSLNRWEHHWGNRSREPLQVAIMVLYRDYTCLYFNIRLLDYGPHHQTAVHACLSNALGILEQTYRIGEMAGLRYLWNQAHSMTAYAAMLIPKVIAWSTEGDTMWKQQATEILDRVASKYLAAMGNPEGSPPSRVSVTMAAQGRLLGAIRARLNPSPRSYIPTPALLQEDMNLFDFPNDISTLSGFFDLGDLTLGEGDYTADSNVEFEALDDEFLRSRYHEAGLAALDEPGIFLHAR
ncbi:uncharacterized protein B0J16DRAFT_384037 [Fusarium flagelliforme]|uniref:uncharacterized protein n=1 Tax=Fusarium flagelliforme TaxID=2675880 RepID=UPI001E8E9DBB|nr:uncharacterized protein B0J16DRAFT_384037 [Fusarium flagelliforme]KAH7184979.1 hypothetical protein B0J16DRAFT_384037 [Fusarium flagelliforme]